MSVENGILAMFALVAGGAFALGLWRMRGQAWRYRHGVWLVLSVSLGLFVAETLQGEAFGPLSPVLLLGGMAGCGLAWLMARALFHPPDGEPLWPLGVVGVLFATGLVLALGQAAGVNGGAGASGLRAVANTHMLVSSTVLVLVFLEVFQGYGPHLSAAERQFRIVFALSYGLLLAVSVLWIWQSGEDTLAAASQDTVQAGAALVAIAGASLALRFRDAHALPRRARAPRSARRGASHDDRALAERIEALVRSEAVFATPNLRVADVARMLGEADYRVSQAITGALGFRNFNHMVNHFRIAEARRRLQDPRYRDCSILDIALDCGFGSIGPFNRAFREETGETPRAVRQASLPQRRSV